MIKYDKDLKEIYENNNKELEKTSKDSINYIIDT